MNDSKRRKKLIFKGWAKVAVLVGVLIVLLAVVVLVALLNSAYALSPDTALLVQEAVARQQNTEKNISAYYTTGEFSFTTPLVIQNPYGTAPLTALLLFDTPQAAQVSIHVPGKSAQAAVDATFATYSMHHAVPVYGLYPGDLNVVVVSLKLQNGQTTQTEVKLQTEALPVYLQNVQVDALNRAQYSPGFNFTFTDHKVIYDINGVVRWYSTEVTFRVFTKLANGRYLYTYSVHDSTSQVVMEEDLLGKIYTIYTITDGVQHDIYELPDGNFLLTSQDSQANTNQDFILEIDRGSGHVVRSFDLKQTLDQYRPSLINTDGADWLHLNSIVYDPSDSSVIISSRSQSAVVKLSYPEMKIQWILGPHDNWKPQFQPYLLTPVGQNFEWSWSQHDATLYSPNSDGGNSVNILLFDNGVYRSSVRSKAYSAGESYSRVVQYRIDPKKMTVEQVWQYGKQRGSELFSTLLGSAMVLANGNVLGDWAEIRKDAAGNPTFDLAPNGSEVSRIIEVNPTTSEVVSEYTIPTDLSYRVFRAGLYDGYSESNAFISTSINDTSVNDLVDRSQLLWREVKKKMSPAESSIKRFVHNLFPSIKL